MALNKSDLLIRDYENIRGILRDIYIFGCFSRDDFIEKKGISGRKYDKEQKRISAYLPERFIQKRRIGKKVFLYCTYDLTKNAVNPLADTYRNKSFTALDIMAYFFVQQQLNERSELTAAEILEALPVVNEKVVFTKDNLRFKLEELVEKGYITTFKNGRRVMYRLSDDLWQNFDDEELLDIYTYLEFVKNVCPLEMPYFFLHRKLGLYLRIERKKDVDMHEVFRFKHNHLFNSLDNDIMLELLRALKSSRDLVITTKVSGKEMEIIPAEIIHDSTYGRQYLYCIEKTTGQKKVIRLDHILAVSSGKICSAADLKLAASLKAYSETCWCTSGTGRELTEIVIEFHFDEVKEDYILRRIKTEGHSGDVKKIADGIYEYRLSLRDPDEMIPWIRSFGERARVISSGDQKTERKIAEDWKRALEKYDSIR